MEKLLPISGVYIITNRINGKRYVGSTTNYKMRKRYHINKCRKGKNASILIQRAYNKYGKGSLKIELVARCPPEYVLKLEQWFIDNLKPEYNVLKIAGSPKGRKMPKEAIERIRNYQLSVKKNEAQLKALKDNSIKVSKGINQYDLEGNLIKEWNSLSEATKFFNPNTTSCTNLSNACKGKRKTFYGYKWEYRI